MPILQSEKNNCDEKTVLFVLVVMSVLAVFGCRGKVSPDETETSVFTLDADVELNDITLHGKLLSSVDLAQVSKAGFLVSESESFPSGQTPACRLWRSRGANIPDRRQTDRCQLLVFLV